MIYFIVGSTGAGKTRYAIELAKERGAIRFAIDDWMSTLFFPDLKGEISFDWAMERINRCEEQIWKLTRAIVATGQEVILEISLSTRELRDKQRGIAQEAGIDYQIHYLDVDRETRRKRVLERNQSRGETWFFDVDDGMFDFVEQMFEPPSTQELQGAVLIRE